MMMRGLLTLLVIGAAVVFFYPLVSEDTRSSCDALERLTVRLVSGLNDDVRPGGLVFAQLMQGLSHGQFAAVAAKDRYPSLPPGVACTVLYWRALTDTDDYVKSITPAR